MTSRNPRHIVDNAREQTQTARQRIRDLNRDVQAALHEAASFTDANLSAQGLDAKRAELREAIRVKYDAKLTELREELARSARILREEAEDKRPAVAADPASLMRAQSSWDRVRMKLEAGMTIPKVLESATGDELLAMREWGPTWLTVQNHTLGDASQADTEGLLDAIDSRLGVVDQGEFGGALTDARAAATEEAYATPLLDHLAGTVAGHASGQDGLYAATAAHYAAQAVESPVVLQDAGDGDEGAEAAA